MKWYLLAWQRFAEFGGRSRRMEYWIFALINVVVFIVLYLAGTMFALIHQPGIGALCYFLYFAYALAVLVPSISCGARRLHDTNKTAWLLLLGIVPVVNIALLVLLALDGTRGNNQYGPDPKMAG
ncbi:MAG TPA: DUF805 domain-containing protein [Terracidiphilus sp.]|nr:DUF805 domain-containing protein [Terracidiphilus sp.]